MMTDSDITMFSPLCQTMHTFVKDSQNTIVEGLGAFEDSPFITDVWDRPGGGGGITKVIEGGTLFEKGGVNTSAVYGVISDKEKPMFSQLLSHQGMSLPTSGTPSFFATGVSLVLHPKNPMVPTIHANFRYFELQTDGDPIWWFGGGTDLTPYMLFEEDARHFHQTYKDVCDGCDDAYYPAFKKRCDEYFYLPHRGESRGIGGVFFDYLQDKSQDDLYGFVSACTDTFLPSYLPIVERRHQMPFTEDDRGWQSMRRGRYVEFNLLYDRGTLFGLRTNGRIESILMSLPPTVEWHYMNPEGYDEMGQGLIQVVKSPRDWV